MSCKINKIAGLACRSRTELLYPKSLVRLQCTNWRTTCSNYAVSCATLPESFHSWTGVNILITVDASQLLNQLSAVISGHKQTLMSLEKLGYRLTMPPSQHLQVQAAE